MTRNMHLLKTKNPHFINARSSGMSETQLCCYRYMMDLCNTQELCPVDCELKKILEVELKEEKDLKEGGP